MNSSIPLQLHHISHYNYTIFHITITSYLTLQLHQFSHYNYTIFHITITSYFTLQLHYISHYSYTIFHISITSYFTLQLHHLITLQLHRLKRYPILNTKCVWSYSEIQKKTTFNKYQWWSCYRDFIV